MLTSELREILKDYTYELENKHESILIKKKLINELKKLTLSQENHVEDELLIKLIMSASIDFQMTFFSLGSIELLPEEKIFQTIIRNILGDKTPLFLNYSFQLLKEGGWLLKDEDLQKILIVLLEYIKNSHESEKRKSPPHISFFLLYNTKLTLSDGSTHLVKIEDIQRLASIFIDLNFNGIESNPTDFLAECLRILLSANHANTNIEEYIPSVSFDVFLIPLLSILEKFGYENTTQIIPFLIAELNCLRRSYQPNYNQFNQQVNTLLSLDIKLIKILNEEGLKHKALSLNLVLLFLESQFIKNISELVNVEQLSILIAFYLKTPSTSRNNWLNCFQKSLDLYQEPSNKPITPASGFWLQPQYTKQAALANLIEIIDKLLQVNLMPQDSIFMNFFRLYLHLNINIPVQQKERFTESLNFLMSNSLVLEVSDFMGEITEETIQEKNVALINKLCMLCRQKQLIEITTIFQILPWLQQHVADNRMEDLIVFENNLDNLVSEKPQEKIDIKVIAFLDTANSIAAQPYQPQAF